MSMRAGTLDYDAVPVVEVPAPPKPEVPAQLEGLPQHLKDFCRDVLGYFPAVTSSEQVAQMTNQDFIKMVIQQPLETMHQFHVQAKEAEREQERLASANQVLLTRGNEKDAIITVLKAEINEHERTAQRHYATASESET